MAKGGKAKTNRGVRNDSRPCGKAFKKNPGEAPGTNNGKSVGGTSLKRAERRAHLQKGGVANPNRSVVE